jgi:hypothetical protein
MKLGEIGDNRAETWRYDPSKIINTVSPWWCTYAWIMMCQQLNNCGQGGVIDQLETGMCIPDLGWGSKVWETEEEHSSPMERVSCICMRRLWWVPNGLP